MPTSWCRCRIPAWPRRIGYSAESGLPFRQALIRNHYVGRTFIEPSQAIRDFGVKLKLNPVRHLLQGKRVVLVDDSIVRGTTSRKIVRMVRQAGAREVHLRISCPPTVSPCFYGVDTPTRSELIASNHTVEEIRRFVEADSLGYLSLASLRKAVARRAPRILLRLLHGRLSDRPGEHRGADRGPAEAAVRGGEFDLTAETRRIRRIRGENKAQKARAFPRIFCAKPLAPPLPPRASSGRPRNAAKKQETLLN